MPVSQLNVQKAWARRPYHVEDKMRTPFVAGNWKMNTSKAAAIELARSIAQGAPTRVDLGIAPPFVYLDAVQQAIAGSSVLLGAQNCYCESNGAFTGEISIDM